MPGGPEYPVLGGVENKKGAGVSQSAPFGQSTPYSTQGVVPPLVAPPFIASVTQVYAADTSPHQIVPSFIASATSVYAPSVYSSGSVSISTPGTYTWVCPPGVSAVWVEAIGGGGGGGGGNNFTVGGGGGGGGGAFAGRVAVPVTPGTTYTIVVGSAGPGGGAGNPAVNGTPGGDSTFVGDSGVQVVAKGGDGGKKPQSPNSGEGGVGGTAAASTGDAGFKFSGGTGGHNSGGNDGGGGAASGNRLATGADGVPGPGGGAAGANGGGSGGSGGTAGSSGGGNGTTPGGGGGGAGTSFGGGSGAGGSVSITVNEAAFISSVTTLYAPTISFVGSTVVVTTPGTYTWICPPGVTTAYVECYGGGGGAGNNTGGGGSGGGGGGAYAARSAVPVTPGTLYTFTVGAGGLAAIGISTQAATDGTDSSFTGDSGVQVIAKAGLKGIFAGGSGNAGGGAGGLASGSTGDIGQIQSGGNGGDGGGTVPGSGGGGGGASGNYLATGANGTSLFGNAPVGGAGGVGVNGGGSGGHGGDLHTNNATGGSSPGGGGGGAGGGTGGATEDGTAGASGKVLITTNVLVGFISSNTVVYGPAMRPDEVFAPFISSVSALYAPTSITALSQAFIASVTVVYTPTVLAVAIQPSFIASATVVYAPVIANTIYAPFIPSGTVIYAPAVPEINAPFIGSNTHVWGIFSLFNPALIFGGPGNGGESFLIRLAPNGTSETATLTSALAATGNILNVTGDGGFPTDKPFMVTVDDEVMLVFQIAPGNYHVRLRAASNTSASSHTAGTSVVWGDSYDMAISAGFAIANSFTADINSTGTFTYPGWLICFDSSQGYNAAGDRYPMHVAQMLGVFDAGAGSSGTSRCDGAQPSAIHTANGVSDDCPAALTNPARIATDINVGDVAVLRYTNPEAYVLDLGGRSTSLESWFGLKRVNLADADVTFTDPNGIVVDTTGTYDTFTGSVNGEWANPVPLVMGIAPDASDAAGFPIPTPNPVAWTTVTMPASSRHFTRTAIGEKGWPMCCLAVRQGNRRVPYWQSWDWHNYAYVYDGFGTDCTYCQMLINRNGIVFGSVPVVIFPNDDPVDGPDAVWDDGTYDFGASWFVALFNAPYIVAGPTVGGSVVIAGGAGGPVPTVGFGGGPTPGVPSIVTPPPIEGGAGGGIEQPPIGLHVWQKSGGF